MTDPTPDQHTIDAAYERLTTALLPPPGADALVAARVVQRRRRRRTVQGLGGAAAAASVIAGVALLSGPGGSASGPARVDDLPLTSSSASSNAPTAPTAPTARTASSAASDPASDPLECASPLPVGEDNPVRLDRLQDLYDALLRVDALGGGTADRDRVRVVEHGSTTTAYLVGDDGRASYALRAERVEGDLQVRALLTCD